MAPQTINLVKLTSRSVEINHLAVSSAMFRKMLDAISPRSAARRRAEVEKVEEDGLTVEEQARFEETGEVPERLRRLKRNAERRSGEMVAITIIGPGNERIQARGSDSDCQGSWCLSDVEKGQHCMRGQG